MIRGQDTDAAHPGDFRRWRGVRFTVTALLLALLALPRSQQPPTISISPPSRSLETGTVAEFTITYKDGNGAPKADVPIGIMVKGTNSYSNPVTYRTDTQGKLRVMAK